MVWERRRLLVWGKTYPEHSKTYYETVCTGAVDGTTGRLIRIYPLQLRHLTTKFPKYTWIEADIERNEKDPRPESFKIQQDKIVVHEKLDPQKKDGWSQRAKWVLGPDNVFQSLEDLRAAQERDRTSLGVVRIREIVKVRKRRKADGERAEWEAARNAAAKQRDFFIDPDDVKKELVFCPVEYFLHFLCADPACTKPHECSIRDWEIYQLDYRQYARVGPQQAEEDVAEKIMSLMDPAKRDTYVFMGNTQAHPASFMVVGLFYPPKREEPKQTSMFRD